MALSFSLSATMSSTADTSACWYSPDSEEESTQTSSRRRVRTSGDAKWAKTRGVRGLLSCIVDFPQDILYEVRCFLPYHVDIPNEI